jgi:hypothetical protein
MIGSNRGPAGMNMRMRISSITLVAVSLLSGCGGGRGKSPGDGGIDRGATAPLWVGVIGTGQSLSVGAASNGLVFTSPSPASFKLSLGARETTWPIDAADPELSLVALAEPIRTINTTSYSAPYPINIYGETFHSAMAAQLDVINGAVVPGGLASVHSVVGQGDSSITVIEKNGSGNAYAASLFEAAALTRLVAAAGARYEVFAVVLTHGEKDAERPSYEDDIARLQADYEQDLQAITGQTRAIPLILTQQHADPVTGRSTSTVAAWKAGVDHAGKIYCAGPKYQYGYATDRIHLVAGQYDRLGVKYAEVVHALAVRGNDWQPLQPIGVTVEGQTVAVRFHVPFPPLAWDEAFGAPHQFVHTAWKNGRGFEAEDSQGEVTITDATIDGDTIRLGIDRVPDTTTAPLMVRYAMTQDATTLAGGLVSGRFGQLHDSDPLIGVDAIEIDCMMTNGSTQATAVTAGAFLGRAAHDMVDVVGGWGLDGETTVVAMGASIASLSLPWTGATGPARLRFRSNQWNYAVAFEMVASP